MLNLGWSRVTAKKGKTIKCKAHSDISQVIPSGVNTKLKFEVLDYDTGNLRSSDNGVFKIEEAGEYLICSGYWYPTSITRAGISIIVNGLYISGTITGSDASASGISASTCLHLNENDKIEIYAVQETGKDVSTYQASDGKPYITIVKIGD